MFRYQKIVCFFLLLPFVFAENWSCWRGEKGDGIAYVSQVNMEPWPTKGLKEIWRISLGTGYSGLSVVNGVIYTLCGTHKYEYCVAINEKNGKELWRRRIGYVFENKYGNGPRSTPAISKNRVYAINSYGEIWCLNSKNGRKIWQYNLLDKLGGSLLNWGICSSPLIYKDKLFFNTGAGNNKSIVALDCNTGQVVWSCSSAPSSYSSPIIATTSPPHIVFFAGNGGMGISPDTGEILWTYPWKTYNNINASTPIYQEDYVYFSSDYGKGAALINVDSLNNYKVKEVWKNRKIRNHFSSSILWKGHLYGFHGFMLACVSFKTGKIQWKTRGYNKGSILGLSNGHAIILGEKGKLALIELDSKQYKNKGLFFPFSKTLCRTIPTVVNDRLYIRNQNELVCFDLGVP